MALTPSYEHSATMKKINVNGSIYWVKDADLRLFVESFNDAVFKSVDATFDEDGVNLATEAAIAEWVEDKIAGLEGAMHFRGVLTGRQEGETDAQMLARLITDPKAGDVVIIQDNGKEYIRGTSAWEEIGDQNIYLTIAAAAATYVPLTRTIAGIDLQDNITADEVKTALGLGALAYKSSATGTLSTADSIDDISVGKAGEYDVTGSNIAVPQTFSALDVTPSGDVTITPGVAAAAQYDKVSGITVSAATAGESQTANYVPAGSITLPTLNASVELAKADVATVTDAGTAYSITDGSVSKADDTTASFAAKTVKVEINSTDAEQLDIAYATASDTGFFASAVTAAGAVTYTAPVLSGALPTFGTKNVATGVTSATAGYNGDASFSGTGVVIGAEAAFTATAATVTQPTFTAEFDGDEKSVTPAAATTSNAVAAGAKVTVASDTVSLVLNKTDKTVEVQ